MAMGIEVNKSLLNSLICIRIYSKKAVKNINRKSNDFILQFFEYFIAASRCVCMIRKYMAICKQSIDNSTFEYC